MYMPQGSQPVNTIDDITDNIYNYFADEEAASIIFTDAAFVDFTPDIKAMITAISARFTIGWAFTGGLGCNRFKYKSPDEIINAYEGGDTISAISGITNSNIRRTAFNSYPPHIKNYIRNMIRAKFSMMRGEDYNNTYFPMDKDGNINLVETQKIYYEYNALDFEDKTTTGKITKGLSSGKTLWVLPIIKWILKLGIGTLGLSSSIFLAPALYGLISIFAGMPQMTQIRISRKPKNGMNQLANY
jgi:hypothetical protein